VGGLPKLQGDSVAEKRDYVRNKKDYLRTFLCNEPRGHNVEAAILTDSGNAAIDFGVFFFSADGYDEMSGHGIIGVCTALIEMGMVNSEEPTTKITLETPAGLIKASAEIIDGKVKGVSLLGVPSFLY
jgi:proline racemase